MLCHLATRFSAVMFHNAPAVDAPPAASQALVSISARIASSASPVDPIVFMAAPVLTSGRYTDIYLTV
jgi:hypothetical protein